MNSLDIQARPKRKFIHTTQHEPGHATQPTHHTAKTQQHEQNHHTTHHHKPVKHLTQTHHLLHNNTLMANNKPAKIITSPVIQETYLKTNPQNTSTQNKHDT